MNIHTFISADDVTTGAKVLAWAKNYLAKEHSKLNRPHHAKAVCPYVEASLKSNRFYIVFHDKFDGRDCAAIADQIMDYALPFKEAYPTAPNEQMLKALLIVFPSIEPRFFTVLDECHLKIKPKMVELGLMVGQFHPNCRERAIHNRRWNSISKSPVPLMALRHMTIHDIMFLGDNQQTFREYESRFGSYFRESDKSLRGYQKHLLPYYQRAKVRYSTNPTISNHNRH
jgi:heptaprenyl diphosphate synthase